MNVLKIAGLSVFFFFIIAPALTFLHEAGHSIVPLLKGELVNITFGGYVGKTITLEKLSITYAGPWLPWVGFTKWYGDRDILRLALGPITSLVLAILCFFLLKQTSNRNFEILVKIAMFWSLGAFISTAFPFNYPSMLLKNPTDASDGKQIIEILQSSR